MSEWSIACDRPGCSGAITATAPLAGLFAYAETQGWQIEPAIAPLRHFCPAHHVGEVELAQPVRSGIWRAP